jgi:RimJ/RimL family protein N-acetyltransferase
VVPLTLETERLQLRPLSIDDVDELAPLHAEETFWRFPLGRGQTYEETRAFVEAQLERYAVDPAAVSAVVERSTGRLTGWGGLAVPHFLPEVLPAVEVGWRFGRAWWGRGYATEVGAAGVRYGFEQLDLDRIISIYEPPNTASGRVMDRLGFGFDHAADHPRTGAPLHVRSLTREAWEKLDAEGTWPRRPA